ncbi:squalene--hopene cyclase [Mesorhizobium sp. BAC0120]|uniref:squalene--hopene cyclase n=1 Tax=Mesorhizobium sp. BAC0120 TaxID=3090670 RepID=UPI00298C911F|nr:squalene--hopene cyclase [Mesorhizobium sp. BAC0120]MDW6026151.1 squalene--hopene cyclase [Mesorhizobium sp. BAC0120]
MSDTSIDQSVGGPDASKLERAIGAASEALLVCQHPDGHWIFELEADATIPAEYVLLRHYLGEPVDASLEAKIAAYLRRIQRASGGWPLFHDGEFDMSASVKAYFALNMIGDDPGAEHMRRACEAIRARGGAEESNVFTRILLALYGILPWRAVPVMPVEIMLLPRWFPFHLSKISYWARTVIVPLLVLQALKPTARNPKGVGIDELFLGSPRNVGPRSRAPHQKRSLFLFFAGIDAVLRLAEPFFPKGIRKRAIDKAVSFVTERLNGKDGLGAIFPAMANSVMMFDVLGWDHDHPDYVTARASIERLLVTKAEEAYCQPCVSPVWDTALACHALLEAGTGPALRAADAGLTWLQQLQVLDVAGDWTARRPDTRPGGWAFQYANPHYPDLDDTAVVVMAMDRIQKILGHHRFQSAIERGREWILGLQSRSGGWAAFDADNEYLYLNNIPFADHGALPDPPSEDVTARCVSMFAQFGERPPASHSLSKALAYLSRKQRPDGSWYGRWGMNYIYGTWSALCGLSAIGMPPESPQIRQAVSWLLSIQNADGGWGEGAASYALDYRHHQAVASTASQTSWALLGLMAAGAVSHPAVARGIDFLLRTQKSDGFWEEDQYTGTGFPRAFYLRYHGYPKFFPLWALARYRNVIGGGATSFGM